MKKRLSMILAAVAMMVTGASNLGCMVWVIEEPSSIDVLKD